MQSILGTTNLLLSLLLFVNKTDSWFMKFQQQQQNNYYVSLNIVKISCEKYSIIVFVQLNLTKLF